MGYSSPTNISTTHEIFFPLTHLALRKLRMQLLWCILQKYPSMLIYATNQTSIIQPRKKTKPGYSDLLLEMLNILKPTMAVPIFVSWQFSFYTRTAWYTAYGISGMHSGIHGLLAFCHGVTLPGNDTPRNPDIAYYRKIMSITQRLQYHSYV